MAERTHIPTSPACGEWETLLADALDGQLRAEDEATFSSHMAGCANCTGLFEEARRGREWLNFLSAEPEVPEGLLDKILAQTGPGHKQSHAVLAGGAAAMPFVPAWQRPGFMGHIRRFAEPRLMMTAAMAFFSIALTLNLTGIRLNNLRLANLRPVAVRAQLERRLTMASVPIVRYYDHLRFIYDVESTVRQLRGDSEEDNSPQQPAGAGGSGHIQNNGGPRLSTPHGNPPQQSGVPARQPFADYLDTSLKIQGPFQIQPAALADVRALSNGCTVRIRERKTVWTA